MIHTPPTPSVMVWIKYISQHPNYLLHNREFRSRQEKNTEKKLFKIFLIEPYEGFQSLFFF